MAEPASARAYVATFAALLVLTAVTTGVAYVDLGALNVPLALLIAGAKGALVVAIFMHARASGRLGALFAGVGLFWVLVLIGLTVADAATRAGA